MRKPIVTCDEDATTDKVAELLDKHGVGAVVVTRYGEPVGIVTGRDLAAKVIAEGKRASEVRVKDVMTPYLITIDADADVREAAKVMGSRRLRRLLVTDKGKIVGIITVTGILMGEKRIAEAVVKKFAEAAAEEWERMMRLAEKVPDVTVGL
ncbi:hypothetical protein DRN98_09500 [Methanosarcinales archaeon]|uniref:Cystathionine beta-synthase, core domain protein n=1 Tax=Candidatus Syntropharchaeum caldarium TaxID=1838285 RepID=A0A1F2PDT9_9EURY|nr:MAG: Cystathionine beta-synthase, core domain protein [Candidatus Syntrophoarchaeum caldarius]RLG28538.1 MAG: hypothetical protein DRN98_09500 [Methanosarcinales archaeon]